MPTWFLDTLKQGIRQPGPWVVLIVGLALGWSGLELAILALGEWETQAPALTQSTAVLAGALTVFWICARLLDDDRRSSLCLAADGTAPGGAGRLLGRWLGAAMLGIAVCTVISVGLRRIAGVELGSLEELWLYSAIITCPVRLGLAAAWAVLLSTVLRGPGALLAGAFLWAVAHLPWGGPGLLDGRVGEALGALLPGPRLSGDPAAWLPATLAGIAAILLLALAVGERPWLRR